MLLLTNTRRVASTLAVAAMTGMTACGADGTTAPRPVPVEDGRLTLSQVGAQKIPVMVDEFSVDSGDAALRYETWVEGGELTLTSVGTPRYELNVRYATYGVTFVDGQKVLRLIGTSRERDHGQVQHDSRGEMVLTSDYIAPLVHTASPVTGGVRMAYRVPGDDVIRDLFYRREPD